MLFGRDRLGYYSDRNPGQFVLSISDDNAIFTGIINSADYGFSGVIGLGQTIEAAFDEVSARYVRLKFANPGAAIDEVEIINSSISAVPIPATVWLFGSGLFGLIGFSKRKKAA